MPILSFDSLIAADALEHIKALGATLHTYTPRGAAALSRFVFIDRGTKQNTGGVSSAFVTVDAYIVNSTTNGVDNVTVGGDKIAVVPRLGETAKTYLVVEIIEQDAGIWHLSLEVNG